MSYSDVLIGLQFGDEGKAKIIDLLAEDYDIIARFNGGSNAGHTVVHEGKKLILRQIPSGVMYADKQLYIGSGCALNLVQIADEIARIESAGIDVKGRLAISGLISVIQPHHIELDCLFGKYVGTTKNGIGPYYAGRCTRVLDQRLQNIRLGELLMKEELFEAIADNYRFHQEIYGFESEVDLEDYLAKMRASLKNLEQCIVQEQNYLLQEVKAGKTVLFEGAQSFLLDVIKGTVPFVTSSHTMASYAYVGGDLPAKYHRKTIGVAKAVMSRVGEGPFLTEIGDDSILDPVKNAKQNEAHLDVEKMLLSSDTNTYAQGLRIASNEYGSATGRPRRMGHLDIPLMKWSIECNGVDEVYLNKIDLFNLFAQGGDKIPVVSAYQLAEGAKTDRFSPLVDKIERPDYLDIPSFSDPKKSEGTVLEIEKLVGTKIKAYGIGPAREEMIFRS